MDSRIGGVIDANEVVPATFQYHGIDNLKVDRLCCPNIYKSTGTASSEVMNSFAFKVKRERNDKEIAMV